MKIQYYNYHQAAAIAADYQQLVGQPFEPAKPEEGTIAEVLVAPYSRILQWRFLLARITGTGHAPIETMSPNGRYEVLVLPAQHYNPDVPFRAKCLRDYLQEQNLPFNPAAYKKAATNA